MPSHKHTHTPRHSLPAPQGSHPGKAALLVLQPAVLLAPCLRAAWSGAGARAQLHVRAFLLLKVGARHQHDSFWGPRGGVLGWGGGRS